MLPDYKKYNLLNEDLLIARFQAGDKESFRYVHDLFVRELMYFANNIIFSLTDAEDILANSFYKLFHARSGMNSLEHIKRFMYVIIRNESIDYLRKRTKVRKTQEELAYLESDLEEHAETERMKAALLGEILRAIENLPPQRRTVIKLYFLDQKTTAEIAEQLGLNSQTVLNHKTKALESLRKTFPHIKNMAFVLAAVCCCLQVSPDNG